MSEDVQTKPEIPAADTQGPPPATALPPEELAKIVRRMTQEKIVEFAAAVQ